MELWVILLFLWIAWKVFGSILEEMQKRKQEQQPKESADKIVRRSAAPKIPPLPRPAQRTAENPSAPISARAGGEENELERLLREALARKRGPQPGQHTTPASRPAAARAEREQRIIVQPAPTPAPVKAPAPAEQYRVTAPRRLEPPPVPFERYQVEARQVRKRTKRPIRPTPAFQETATRVAKPLRVSERARVTQRQRSSPHVLKGLSLDDIRKGIILSEIVKPPKALSGVDAYVDSFYA